MRLAPPTAVRLLRETSTHDGTRKLLVALADGARVETVLIPTARRTSVCVSTQTFCARGCIFCVTAALPPGRSLSGEEIVAQVGLAALRLGELPPLRNVVFMGMGEPLDNLVAVEASVRALVDPKGGGFAPRHVTVSTVGTTPALVRRLATLPANLAWSLHSADEDLRRRLIPTARGSLLALRDAFAEVVAARRRVLFVEMTLIDGLNDAVDDAEATAAFLLPFAGAVRVNLLPMNHGRPGLRAAPVETVERYRQTLRRHGLFCTLRRERGGEDAAACGQLGAAAQLTSTP